MTPKSAGARAPKLAPEMSEPTFDSRRFLWSTKCVSCWRLYHPLVGDRSVSWDFNAAILVARGYEHVPLEMTQHHVEVKHQPIEAMGL